jgi:hypothetical protein
LKMKMAPLMGLVVRLPSKVLWMVTCRKECTTAALVQYQ